MLLVVGSGAGLYLSQQTQDIRQDASVGSTNNIGVPSVQESNSTQSETCNYSCSGGHPNTPEMSGADCGNARGIDVCRGKGTHNPNGSGKALNCQLCVIGTKEDTGGNFDYRSMFRAVHGDAEADKREDNGWYACPSDYAAHPEQVVPAGCDYSCLCGDADQGECYEWGPGHKPKELDPKGNYSCRNTQIDVVLDSVTKWNCVSTDNRNWSECNPPAAPASCQSVVLSPGGTVTDQNVNYKITATAGSTGAELCFHSKDAVVAGDDAWSKGWHCLQPTPPSTPSNPYAGSFKYEDIRNAIVAINPAYGANIDAKGYRYATRIYTSENVFCTGNGVWSDGGSHHGSTTCAYNNACGGFIAPKPLIPGPSCKSLSVTGGAVVGGVRQVPTGATKLTFSLAGEFPGGTIAGDQICFYPNYLGDRNDWSLGWHCLPSNSSIAPDPYYVEKTYNEIKAGIRSRDPNSVKITDAQIDSDGFRYAGNIHSPQGTFCDGGNKWTGVGDSLYTACTFNVACAGKVRLVAADELSCGAPGCTTNADCKTGLVCVAASDGRKYCARNTEYNLASCAENPSNATCCQDEKLIQCNSDCTTGAAGDAECSAALGVGYSCIANKCRLTENPTSATCTPLTPIACNGTCTPGATGDAQCQKTNPKYFCAPQAGNLGNGRCRHKEWPESPTCKKPDPVCVGITMSPAVPQINSEVTFTCSLVAGINEYQFRIIEPGAIIPTPLAVFNKNISVPYKVGKPGSFRAECRLCPADIDNSTACLDWPQ